MHRTPENHNTWQPFTRALGGAIRELMAARQLSLHRFSETSGLDRKVLRGLLSGAHQPYADTLDRAACGLDLLVSDIVGVAEWRAGLRVKPPAVAVRLKLAGARHAPCVGELRIVVRVRAAAGGGVQGAN